MSVEGRVAGAWHPHSTCGVCAGTPRIGTFPFDAWPAFCSHMLDRATRSCRADQRRCDARVAPSSIHFPPLRLALEGVSNGPPMLVFVLRRLMQAVIVMLAVAFIAFMLFQYVGDPVMNILGQDATPEQRQQLRVDLGLDKPFPVQFAHFVGHAFRASSASACGRAARSLRSWWSACRPRWNSRSRRHSSRWCSAFRWASTRRCGAAVSCRSP